MEEFVLEINKGARRRHRNFANALAKMDQEIRAMGMGGNTSLHSFQKALNSLDMKNIILGGLFKANPEDLAEAAGLCFLQKTKVPIRKLVIRRRKKMKNFVTGDAKAPYHHRQFTPALKKAVAPLLIEAGKQGELDTQETLRMETQINKSIRDPNFQIDQKYLSFLIGKLTQKQSWKGGLL